MLQTWLAGPRLPRPLKVVDEREIVWRQYNNVTVDTLSFSVFFGSSVPAYKTRKNEVGRLHSAPLCCNAECKLLVADSVCGILSGWRG